MVVSSLEANITCMDAFSKKNGISKTLSPSAIMVGTQNIDTIHITFQPGSYVNFKVNTISTNDMKTSIVA